MQWTNQIQIKNLLLILTLFTSNLASAQSAFSKDQKYDPLVESLSEKELVKLLKNQNQDSRKAAAHKILDLIRTEANVVAEGNIFEYKKEYWTSKSSASFFTQYTLMQDGKIKINPISVEQFVKEFKLRGIDEMPMTFKNFIAYQLDHIYKLRFRKINKEIDLIDIIESPIHFVVLPESNYSGDWFNFYVTGEIYSKSIYSNGLKMREEVYSLKENMMHQKFYSDGICNRIEFYNLRGKIVKVHYEKLSESESDQVCSRNFTY